MKLNQIWEIKNNNMEKFYFLTTEGLEKYGENFEQQIILGG